MLLSVVTSIKDYVEVVNKLIEYDSVNINYTELSSILTFFIISIKNSLVDFFNFRWLGENLWNLPIIVPQISSAMISEISVLDAYFHNAYNFLDTPISYSTSNSFVLCIEKLVVGLINSFFLFLPTSTAHIITLRRFVIQGLEAGYLAGLGTIAGSMFWLSSVILGWRFFVVAWLSLDTFRYVLGFVLLIKYMWDSYNEKNVAVFTTREQQTQFNNSTTNFTESAGMVNNTKIFLLNFLLALTEQTSIYAFIGNMSITADTSILETFTNTYAQNSNAILFLSSHLCYLIGIGLGSLSLLHFSCWFWENPAFKLYMWTISSFKISTSFYYKAFNFGFLYLTMLSAICSVPYYGLDYAVTNALGYVSDDRIVQDKVILETSFLGTKASDRNTRRNRGRHGRRERWKRRIRKYRAFDASLYNQGIYDLFTVEDLNYGFDRFWLRRKLRNHRVRFRFFPGPWMRSFKKQLAKPRLESYTGPRIEFFRILFEQVYHPSFHASVRLFPYGTASLSEATPSLLGPRTGGASPSKDGKDGNTIYSNWQPINEISTVSALRKKPTIQTINTDLWEKNISVFNKQQSKQKKSVLRKFVRKFDNRIKTLNTSTNLLYLKKPIYSKQWKNFINSINSTSSKNQQTNLTKKQLINMGAASQPPARLVGKGQKDLQILQYLTASQKSNAGSNVNSNASFVSSNNNVSQSLTLLHPLKFYLQKEAGFKRKLRYYTPNIYRKLSVNNTAPFFSVMMKRYFYNYKPSLRWERTMKTASLRKARRKTTRIPRKLQNTNVALTNVRRGVFNNMNDSVKLLPPLRSQGVASLNQNSSLLPYGNQSAEINHVSLLASQTRPGAKQSGELHLTATQKPEQQLPVLLQKTLLQKPTNNYSVVSKRANRYRYEIYKDVLQHWYYSPFNRFLLKLDVDSFIARQPNSHFLTHKEENLLHLRRFLLCEHYNTLRWYGNMQHYRTLKTQLNSGTKSFASGYYNQQFVGTFKKIRHLFAITPSFTNISLTNLSTDGANSRTGREGVNKHEKQSHIQQKQDSWPQKNQPTVLKFDQPLYNQYNNSTKNPLLNSLIIHEEILPDFKTTELNSMNSMNSMNSVNNSPLPSNHQDIKQQKLSPPYQTGSEAENNISANALLPYGWQRSKPSLLGLAAEQASAKQFNKGPDDLITQSQNIVGTYLIQTAPARQAYIQKLLNENNYAELSNFIYKGEKMRGSKPVTNQRLLNFQEKNYLLTAPLLRNPAWSRTGGLASLSSEATLRSKLYSNQQSLNSQPLYVQYLKNYKRQVNNEQSLKNYLTARLDKRQKRKQKKQKQIMTKLQRLEKWFFQTDSHQTDLNGHNENELLTSGLQKSILDGVLTLQNSYTNQQLISTSLTKDCSSDVCQKSLFALPINVKKTNFSNERNLWKTLVLTKLVMDGKHKTYAGVGTINSMQYGFTTLQNLTLRFNHIQYAQKLKLQNDLQASIKAMRQFINSTGTESIRDFDLAVLLVKQNQQNKKQKPVGKKVQLYSWLKNKIMLLNNQYFNMAVQATNNIVLKTQQVFKPFVALVKPIQQKNLYLNDWRKKERVLNKQKRSRKELKLLNKKTESALKENQAEYVDQLQLQPVLRKKRMNDENFDLNNQFDSLQQQKQITHNEQSLSTVIFKRKTSVQRRTRIRRNRGVFKKRNLTDLLKKDFIRFYNEKNSSGAQQLQYINKFNVNLYDNQSAQLNSMLPFKNKQKNKQTSAMNVVNETDSTSSNSDSDSEKNAVALKQRKSKQRKERYWKQKRSKYSQKRRKYRKRRAYTVVKIRSLNKQFKRIKNQISIQNWWWKKLIPSIQASNEALWQIEKNKLIEQKLSQLSNAEILQQNNFNNAMQIGNTDFKPLALPYTIYLQQFQQKNLTAGSFEATKGITSLPFSSVREFAQNFQVQPDGESMTLNVNNTDAIVNLAKITNNQKHSLSDTAVHSTNNSSNDSINDSKFQVINNLYESLFIHKPNTTIQNSSADTCFQCDNNIINQTVVSWLGLAPPVPGPSKGAKQPLPNTNLPFYAGWDESLRKLIVTNRMLSRRDAGFSLAPSLSTQNQSQNALMSPSVELTQQHLINDKTEFTSAPLQGMNAATTLYWQIPFTTYDPDQFFALGMDGFSPIGWRKFLLRHSILKTWLTKSMQCVLFPSEATPPFPTGVLSVNTHKQRKGVASLPYGLQSKHTTNYDSKQLNSNVISAEFNDDITQNAKTVMVVKNRSNILKDFSSMFAVSLQNQTGIHDTQFKSQFDFDVSLPGFAGTGQTQKAEQNKNSFAISRRLKKRYSRVKKHPRTPVWFPSGALLNQVLPVHYIYVFYKRARLPRDRYLKRRLINVKQMNSSAILQKTFMNSNFTVGSYEVANASQNSIGAQFVNYDFTLRKRLKPRRKYHLKRNYYVANVIIPRRLQFMATADSAVQKWRPLSVLKLSTVNGEGLPNQSISEIVKQQQLLRRSALQKQNSIKQQPNMRVKQLRRRVQRQILRSVWRYRPRAGGFVWPGDYLKLELVASPAPKLQLPSAVSNQDKNINDTKEILQISKKQKRKKKRTLVEWQIQPKKYLSEKHNLKVIKKKLLQSPFSSNTLTLNTLRNVISDRT